MENKNYSLYLADDKHYFIQSYVKKGGQAANNTPYIAKSFEQNFDYYLRELRIAKKLKNCKHVAQLVDYSSEAYFVYENEKENERYPVLIFEIGYYGDVGDFLKGFKEYVEFGNDLIPENIAKSFLYDLLVGINEIHEKGIFHRDIKPNNIAFDENFKPIIIDFGLSCERNESQDQEKLIKPKQNGYHGVEGRDQIPEFDEKSDLFSCGVVFHDILFANTVQLFGKEDKCTIGSSKDSKGYHLFKTKGIKKGFKNKEIWERHIVKRELSEEVIEFFHDVFVLKSERCEVKEILQRTELFENRASSSEVKEYFCKIYPLMDKKYRKLNMEINSEMMIWETDGKDEDSESNSNTVV